MKDDSERDAQLRPEEDLVVGVLSQEYSTECQEDEEQDHRHCYSHFDDVGCAEDGVHAGLYSHLMVLVEI